MPFKLGEMVKMRSSALKLVRFCHLPKDDIGIVVGFKESSNNPNDILIIVHWQNYLKKSSKPLQYKPSRLKRVIRKKNAETT